MTLRAEPEQSRFARLIRRGEFYSALLAVLTVVAFLSVALASDFTETVDALGKFSLITIGFVLTMALANYFVRTIRFSYLLARRDYHVPVLQLIEIYLAGFAMTATPGKVGEIVRLWLLKLRYGLPYRHTLPIMIADRAYDVLATTLLCIATLEAFTKFVLPTAIVAVIFVTGCALLVRPGLLMAIIYQGYRLVGRKPRLFGHFRQIVRRTAGYFQARPFAIGVGLGCIGWFMECAALFICARSFVPQFGIEQAIFVFTFANLVGAITLLPGGVGGTEVSMAAILSTLGLTLEQAAAVTFVIRVGTLWFGVCCGYAALSAFFYRQRRNKHVRGTQDAPQAELGIKIAADREKGFVNTEAG